MNAVQKRVIETFRDAMQTGVEKICEAANIYVAAIDGDSAMKNVFMEACPGIPPGAWAGLEAVGRGILDRRLLWGGGRAVSYLRRLPISAQRAALDGGVEMLTAKGEALRVMPEKMTTAQCCQVFAQDHIRDAGEQRAWIEAQAVEHAQPVAMAALADALPWEVAGGKLIVRTPMTLTRRDIQRVLREMEK